LLYWTIGGATPSYSDGYINLGITTGAAVNYIKCINNTFFCDVLFTLDFKATWTSASTAVMKFRIYSAGLYLNSSGAWQAGATLYEYDVYAAEGGTTMADYDTININIGFISRYDLELSIYEMEIDGGSGNLYVRTARLEPTYNSAVPNKYIYAYDNAGTVLNTVKKDIKWGDANILATTLTLSDSDCQWFLQKSTTLNDYINERYIIGHNETVTTPEGLQELLARQVIEANYTAQDMIRGTLQGLYDYSKALTDNDIVDSYGYTKCFIGQELTYDIRRIECSGTWVEVSPIYNDEALDWASETYNDGSIVGNNITVDDDPVSGTVTATSDPYTCVLGEMVRIKVRVFNFEPGTDLPNYDFDGNTGTLAEGYNYLEFRATAGAKTFQINHTDGETADCEIEFWFYSLKGI